MAKRAATSQLNHDNWDEDEESETPGTFKALSEPELKNRIIKKAKRSQPKGGASGSSPFAAFSGFSSVSSSPSPFSFLKKTSSSDTSSSFSANANKEEKKKNGSSEIVVAGKSSETDSANITKSSDSNTSNKQKPIRSIEYYRHLHSLNESVMNWMQLHLSKNSCCDFTPVFNDYKKHLDTLNLTYPVKSTDPSFFKKPVSTDDTAPKQSAAQKSNNVNHESKMSNSLKQEDETDYGAHFSSNTTNTSTFSFGIKRTPSATSSMSAGPNSSAREEAAPPEKKPYQFSFGLKNAQDSSKSFSFASAPIEKPADTGTATEESEYVPPKNDFISVKEEDAFYSKRCKLFYKKDDSFVERGVGILHLKPLDGKTQLLIRADTSLGNILLNIVLSASLPMSRTGKNNVLLVCVPNPPVDPKGKDSKKAIPMLIRVKTSGDADELLEMLNKHKS